jgi:transcriptional regulator with XRE-family HTH domain
MSSNNAGRAALVEWMQSTGISQNEMARRTGIAQTTIGRWCKGHNIPSLDAAMKIEDFTFGKVRAADWVVDR